VGVTGRDFFFPSRVLAAIAKRVGSPSKIVAITRAVTDDSRGPLSGFSPSRHENRIRFNI